MTAGEGSERVGRLVFILVVPAAVALVVALVFGSLGWGAAVLCFGIACAVAWPIAKRHGADVDRLIGEIDALPGSARVEPAWYEGNLGTEKIGSALARVAAALRDRDKGAGESVKLAEELAAALPEPFLFVTKDRRILRGSKAAEDLFGIDLVGRDVAEAVRDPVALAALRSALQDAKPASGEFVLVGTVPRNFLCRALPVADARPGGSAAILLFEDLTDAKRTEKMRADFVANASHEIRTPLASVAGFLETLAGPAKDDPAARERFIGLMTEQVGRIRRLVDDLLSLSRIEVREHMAPTEPVSLGAVLEATVGTLTHRAKGAGTELLLEVASGLPRVAGDATELDQVFHNLIDNAIAYGAGKPVRIVARPAEMAERLGGKPSVVVSVIDQGPGIAREHLPRLTERFYRVDAARSRQMGGTGLGLAIVKHIVNRHRAQFVVKSTPGQGSEFSVIFQLLE